MTRVLMVGFTAEAVDLTSLPLDVDTLRKMIADGHAKVKEAGYDIVYGWIGHDHEAGVADLRRTLRDETVDIVMIGNGVRSDPQYTQLFEQVVNAAHELAPRARFAFNADPGSTLDALRRNA